MGIPKNSAQYTSWGTSNLFFSVGLWSKWLTSVLVESRVGFCDNNAHPSSLAFLCLGLSNWAKPGEVIMKYFAFLQTIIFLVPIFQPKINFLTFKNQIWLTIPRGLWPKIKLSDIFF